MVTVTGPADLPDVGLLFGEAWLLYRGRFAVLMGVMGLGGLATLAGFVLPLSAVYLYAGWGASWALWAAGATVALSAGLWLASWAQAALLEALLHPEAGVEACCRDSWGKILPFSWVCLLYIVAVFGGFYAFVLPGLYLSVALAYAPVVCVAQGKGGLASLRESLRLVEGRWWATLGRLSAAAGVSAAPGFVPAAGPVLSMAFTPFSAAVVAVLYRHAGRTAHSAGPGFWPRAALWAVPAGLLIASWMTVVSLLTLRAQWPFILESLRASLKLVLDLLP